MTRILFTVTNELSYDQRMQRICGTLAGAGYEVMLIGRTRKGAPPIVPANYGQKRLHCWFRKGWWFYAEYNLRLLVLLLFSRADIFCAIDLDTILPVYFASALRNKKRVYDAHELFTEQKEVVTRKRIHTAWMKIERFAVPRFPQGYTVNEVLAGIFHQRYGVRYSVIRNLPLHTGPLPDRVTNSDRYFIYQGAVNEGRCFETLIPAMKQVPAILRIYGDGNFMEKARQLVHDHDVDDKVIFEGTLPPHDLQQVTKQAYGGITLFENTGLNQIYSLANRFFDYTMAGIPQLCVNFPVYAAFNDKYGIALMTDDTDSRSIAAGLNRLLEDENLYASLLANCRVAREALNWESVAPRLIDFYRNT